MKRAASVLRPPSVRCPGPLPLSGSPCCFGTPWPVSRRLLFSVSTCTHTNTCTHTQNSWAPFSMALPVCSLPNSLPVFPTLSHRLGSQGTLATPQGPSEGLGALPLRHKQSDLSHGPAAPTQLPLRQHHCLTCQAPETSPASLSPSRPLVQPSSPAFTTRPTRMMRPDSLHKTPFPLSSYRGWSPPTHLPRPH